VPFSFSEVHVPFSFSEVHVPFSFSEVHVPGFSEAVVIVIALTTHHFSPDAITDLTCVLFQIFLLRVAAHPKLCQDKIFGGFLKEVRDTHRCYQIIQLWLL